MKAVSDKKAAKLKEAGLPVQPLQRKPFKRKHQPAAVPKQREKRVKKAKTRAETGPSTDTLDNLFSRLVRATAGHECQFWGMDGVTCSTQMQCMHLKSRRYRSIRWSKPNAACGCAAHHRFYHDHPDLFYRAVDKLFPGRWDEVQRLYLAGVAPKTPAEKTALADRMRDALKALGGAAVSKGEA